MTRPAVHPPRGLSRHGHRLTLWLDRMHQAHLWLGHDDGGGRRFTGLSVYWGRPRVRWVWIKEAHASPSQPEPEGRAG